MPNTQFLEVKTLFRGYLNHNLKAQVQHLLLFFDNVDLIRIKNYGVENIHENILIVVHDCLKNKAIDLSYDNLNGVNFFVHSIAYLPQFFSLYIKLNHFDHKLKSKLKKSGLAKKLTNSCITNEHSHRLKETLEKSNIIYCVKACVQSFLQ
jgi:hypothetical protein